MLCKILGLVSIFLWNSFADTIKFTKALLFIIAQLLHFCIANLSALCDLFLKLGQIIKLVFQIAVCFYILNALGILNLKSIYTSNNPMQALLSDLLHSDLGLKLFSNVRKKTMIYFFLKACRLLRYDAFF